MRTFGRPRLLWRTGLRRAVATATVRPDMATGRTLAPSTTRRLPGFRRRWDQSLPGNLHRRLPPVGPTGGVISRGTGRVAWEAAGVPGRRRRRPGRSWRLQLWPRVARGLRLPRLAAPSGAGGPWGWGNPTAEWLLAGALNVWRGLGVTGHHGHRGGSAFSPVGGICQPGAGPVPYDGWPGAPSGQDGEIHIDPRLSGVLSSRFARR